jgi:hypothetical protein
MRMGFQKPMIQYNRDLAQYCDWVWYPYRITAVNKVCLNKMYSKIWTCKPLSDMFAITNGLKEGDALLSLLFNFALEYAIRKFKANQKFLKFNGTHQVVIYADDVNLWGVKAYTP